MDLGMDAPSTDKPISDTDTLQDRISPHCANTCEPVSKCLSSQVRLFADDIIVYLGIRKKHRLPGTQKNLEELKRWETEWQIEFNVSKC